MRRGKFDTNTPDSPTSSWPSWAQQVVSLVLLLHLTAILAAAMASHPASPLEMRFAGIFAPYYNLIDQGYAYRYYAPEPPPTPIVTATLRFADGRHDTTVRLPERGTWPRLRYQRQLALANHLFEDFNAAKEQAGDGSLSRWARSYARHLCKTRPGCSGVTLRAQTHLIPDPQRVRESLSSPGASGFDIDAEEFYTTPERIGEYSCDGL